MHKRKTQDRIFLADGCYCSTPKVTPSNWNTATASTKVKWRIHYRFYDPLINDEKGKIKFHQEIFKGMNDSTDLPERRQICKDLIANELNLLINKGYNPATKHFNTQQEVFYEVAPSTPFIKALWKAMGKVTGVRGTLTDMKCVIRGVETAAIQLRFSDHPINKISRKHIKAILERCSQINKRWSPGRYNKYRAYLMRLFKELVAMEAIDINPIRDVQKGTEVKKVRASLTRAQRRTVDFHLKAKGQSKFRLFLRIFFNSGARFTELFDLRGKDVNLADQWFLTTIRKGGRPEEIKKTIRTSSMRFWKMALLNCGPEDYIFSKGLTAGPVHIRPDQVTRRWSKHVKAPVNKGGLNIKEDIYSYKHSNSTETSGVYGEQAAADQNSHKSTAMVVKIYDTSNKDRKHEELKKVNVSFT